MSLPKNDRSLMSVIYEMGRHMRKAYFAWPVAAFAVAGPALAVYVLYNKTQGPDFTFGIMGKNHERHEEFSNRQARIYDPSNMDYGTYQHPRPKF